MRYFIRYVKMKIVYDTLGELLESMRKISAPLITDDEIESVKYTRDFIGNWVSSYEYKYRKKKFWERIEKRGLK